MMTALMTAVIVSKTRVIILILSTISLTSGSQVRRKWKVNISTENEELEGYERTPRNVNHYDSV